MKIFYSATVDTERILKLTSAQKAADEDNDDKDMEHESDQSQNRVFSTLNDMLM